MEIPEDYVEDYIQRVVDNLILARLASQRVYTGVTLGVQLRVIVRWMVRTGITTPEIVHVWNLDGWGGYLVGNMRTWYEYGRTVTLLDAITVSAHAMRPLLGDAWVDGVKAACKSKLQYDFFDEWGVLDPDVSGYIASYGTSYKLNVLL